jgi:hypothetical protein
MMLATEDLTVIMSDTLKMSYKEILTLGPLRSL